MSVSSTSSQPVATTKLLDEQQSSEWQKRVRAELGRIRQQMRMKRSDEVKVSDTVSVANFSPLLGGNVITSTVSCCLSVCLSFCVRTG